MPRPTLHIFGRQALATPNHTFPKLNGSHYAFFQKVKPDASIVLSHHLKFMKAGNLNMSLRFQAHALGAHASV